MNKQQRTALKSLSDSLASINQESDEAETYRETASQVHEGVEGILTEEQEKFDNMPESLQNASTGEAIQEAISALEYAISALENLIDTDEKDENWRDSANDDLNEAVEHLWNII